MHSKSNNVEIMMGTETNDLINELFEFFLKKYQEGLEIKMEGSNFVFVFTVFVFIVLQSS